MNKKQKKWLMFSGWNIDWKCKWQTLLPLRLIQASNRDGTRNDNHLTQQQTCLYTRGESIGEGVAENYNKRWRWRFLFDSCSPMAVYLFSGFDSFYSTDNSTYHEIKKLTTSFKTCSCCLLPSHGNSFLLGYVRAFHLKILRPKRGNNELS